ncbi:MAG TPA: dihydropyrimidinase [Bacillota bacterium]|jgi:dihydropyrimidinase
MKPFDLVVRGGTVVGPEGRRRADVGIIGGKIAAVVEVGSVGPDGLGERDGLGAREVVDAGGRLVFPGAIDAHVHFGLGSGDAATADDFESGSISAACGGVTTFIDFATPEPGQSAGAALSARMAQAAGRAAIDYGLHGVIVQPGHVDEAGELAVRGVSSFKLYLTYRTRGLMASDETLSRLLSETTRIGGLGGVHAEDNETIEATQAKFQRGARTTMADFAASRPVRAESEAIARACRLADAASAPLYVFHLSTAAGLAEIKRARAAGGTVFAETCPHYLLLTDEGYNRPDGYRFLMNPPLRGEADRAALWAALADGSVQVVSSDHCPFNEGQKAAAARSFVGAPAGIGGTELILATLLTGAAQGRLSLERVVELTAANPARLFGLWPRKGRVAPGSDADLAIVDPDGEWTVARGELHSRCDHTVFEGLKARGRVTMTIARGRLIYRDGQFLGRPGAGRFLERRGPLCTSI